MTEHAPRTWDPGTLESYLEIDRITALRLSPAGSRLAFRIARLSADRRRYQSTIGWVAPADASTATTVEQPVEVGPEFAFATEDVVLFRGRVSAAEPWSLWMLDLAAERAQPSTLVAFPGDVTDFAVAASGRLVAKVKLLSTDDLADAAERLAGRTDLGTSAILHDGFPVRAWDRDLGPHRSVLVVMDDWRDTSHPVILTPGIERELDGQFFDVSADGATVATAWHLPEPDGGRRSAIALIDIATGSRRFVADERDVHFEKPRFSPDGRTVLCERIDMATFDDPAKTSLWIIDVETGTGHGLARDLDLWSIGGRWGADSRSVYFVAEDQGRRPIFCVDLDAGDVVTRLTDDDACYTELAPGDGDVLYALRSSITEPPLPVAVDPGAIHQQSRALPAFDARVSLPGTVTEVYAHADDGERIRAWLVLPIGASAAAPAPLVLWVHGGPDQSWVDWSPWGYNPWLLAQQGYAVLLPDPALSTGYGQAFIKRGWSAWGGKPYTDLMSVTDAVVGRADIDETRTAAVGHSFGGYMANWIAGHTERFRAIVSHAGLWDLPHFANATDRPSHWQRRFGDLDADPTRYAVNSPERFKNDIRTPMLLVHGNLDYRVPVTESIQLWHDLTSRGVPGKFLYFPDENHYILKPGNVTLWYRTMLAFLAQHVLGEEWSRPDGV